MSDTLESADSPANRRAAATGFRVRLRNFLPVIFCLLISVVSLLIIFITNHSATHSIEALAEEVMTRVSQRVVEKTSYYLDSAAHMVQVNALAWQSGGQDHFSQRMAQSGLLVSQLIGKVQEVVDGARSSAGEGARRAPREMVGSGVNFLNTFNRTSRGQLELFPYFGLVYYGDQQGNHWLNKREQDGTIHVRVITRKNDAPDSKQALEKLAKLPKNSEQEKVALAAELAPYLETQWYEQEVVQGEARLVPGERDPLKIYDPRLRPWYVGARDQKKLFWTDVYAWEEKYKGVTSRQVGITVSAPVLRGGELVGVSGIDISLQAVSLFLRDMEIMQNGRAFILNDKGETVGLPDYTEVLEKSDTKSDAVRLNHVSKIGDPLVRASYAAIRAELALNEQQPFTLPKERVITFPVDGQNYYGFYKPFAAEMGLNWTVGVVIPEDDFLGSIKQEMRQSLLIALASIGFMLAAGIMIGRLITNPLTHLGKEVERIMQLDLAPTPSLTTRFVEFGMISLAFSRMKLTLAEMVNSLSVHTKTLDWSAEEFANTAMTLEDSTQVLHESLQTLQAAQLPEELADTLLQIEESVRVLSSLSQPVVERVESMNQGAQALRKTLQSVRI
ncbi:MAG: methyl-accepting chemotaxis protein [Magnetococcales bacterium]|nr:methyl-accepting chemotaxis protein [Magnetococcales bacterium]